MMNIRELEVPGEYLLAAHDTLSVSDGTLCLLYVLPCYQIPVKVCTYVAFHLTTRTVQGSEIH